MVQIIAHLRKKKAKRYLLTVSASFRVHRRSESILPYHHNNSILIGCASDIFYNPGVKGYIDRNT